MWSIIIFSDILVVVLHPFLQSSPSFIFYFGLDINKKHKGLGSLQFVQLLNMLNFSKLLSSLRYTALYPFCQESLERRGQTDHRTVECLALTFTC